MKIKLSKSQWEFMGRKAGWIRMAQSEKTFRIRTNVIKELLSASHSGAIYMDKSLEAKLESMSATNASFVNLSLSDMEISELKDILQNEVDKIKSQGEADFSSMSGNEESLLNADIIKTLKLLGEKREKETNKVCNDCKKRPVWGQYGEFSRCKECYDKQVDAGERASLDK